MRERQVNSRMQSYIGLDIGTTKIAAVIGQADEGGVLKIVGVGHARSPGIRRGVVVDLESTVTGIKTAVAEAERFVKLQTLGACLEVPLELGSCPGGPARIIDASQIDLCVS